MPYLQTGKLSSNIAVSNLLTLSHCSYPYPVLFAGYKAGKGKLAGAGGVARPGGFLRWQCIGNFVNETACISFGNAADKCSGSNTISERYIAGLFQLAWLRFFHEGVAAAY